MAIPPHPTPHDRPARPRIGVALGGGSARGYAHIGALAVLERHELEPDVIVGTSFGAVVGALYASGHSIGRMTREASALRRRDVFPHVTDFGLHKAALFEGRRLEAYFERLTEGRTFADLERPFAVVATDVDTGERVVLQRGSVAKALRASSSLPGIFCPVEWEGRRLVDGGIGSPIPLDTLEGFDVELAVGIGAGVENDGSVAIQFAQRVLASNVGKRLHEALGGIERRHPLARLGRALAITCDAWLAPQDCSDRLHVQTRPPISWLNFHRATEAIRAGEEALELFVPRLKTALAELP